MKILALFAVIAVAFANITMNIWVRNAAVHSDSYSSALASRSFLIALGAGSLSILTLLLVYRLNVNLAQGILLMGAELFAWKAQAS